MRWGAQSVAVDIASRRALDEVTVNVAPGAITAVVGGDGAGKTTLLRVMAGTCVPQAGQVRRPSRWRIGGQLGASGVWNELTVRENLAFAAACYGIGQRDAARRADELTELAGLAPARERLAAALSGGMRQKLGVCAALMHQPELVLLDEPTTGVDPVSRVELWRLVAAAAADGAAVLLTTTHPDEAERAARLLVLDRGVGLLEGAPARLGAIAAAGGLEEAVVRAQMAREECVA